jgi:3-hexulose-6-phosphate synthase
MHADSLEAHLQLALDHTDLGESERLVRQLSGRLARVEVGTPLLVSEGLRAVERVRALVGDDIVVVADTKICDAGKRIASSAWAAGADIVTIVAAAIDRTTWEQVVTAASESSSLGRADSGVLVDAMNWTVRRSDLLQWSISAAALAVRFGVCVHRPRERPRPLPALIADVRVPGTDVEYVVAGSMTVATVQPALSAGFSTVIVGQAIADSDDPQKEWDELVAAVENVYEPEENR